MDQDQARVLFEEGATLVLLDVPVGTEFGIDYNSWQAGPKFKGIKMIPPGIHFVYYSAMNKENEQGPRTGFFYNFQQKEMVVRFWDPSTEDVMMKPMTDEELERFSQDKKNLDSNLGAYPYENYKKWVSLTSHITPSLLTNLLPLSGKICSVKEFQSERTNTEQRKAACERRRAALDQHHSDSCERSGATCEQGVSGAEGGEVSVETLDGLPFMKSVPGTDLRFTAIPKQKFPTGATPQEVTKYSMDYSYALETMISHYKETEEILGEMQFAFICFIVGQVYEGFEHWKHVVNLLCNCSEALVTHDSLFKQFVTVLHFQLKEVPPDFFVDIVSQDNFLTVTLHSFFDNLETSDAGDGLKVRGFKFRDHLTKTYKWDFMSEPDEYAPVIVEEG